MLAFKVYDSGFCRSLDCREERKIPWSQNALVCDYGGHLGVLIR
jgi:hypothetical protein